MEQNNSYDAYVISFDEIHRREGNLSAVTGSVDIPFDIKRVYYMTAVPEGSHRGMHAHKELEQVIICINGLIGITLDDGVTKTDYILHTPKEGLFVPKGLWRELRFVSENSICLVLASKDYDENDYIRNYNDFKQYRNVQG